MNAEILKRHTEALMEGFSQRFADRLVAKFPEWRSAVTWQDGYPLLTVSPPSSRAAWPLYVYTEDNEITVGFDRWHGHFCADDDKE